MPGGLLPKCAIQGFLRAVLDAPKQPICARERAYFVQELDLEIQRVSNLLDNDNAGIVHPFHALFSTDTSAESVAFVSPVASA